MVRYSPSIWETRTKHVGTQNGENDLGLAACRSWEELAKCDDVGVVLLLELLAAFDELRAEIAETRDRSTAARKPQAKKD